MGTLELRVQERLLNAADPNGQHTVKKKSYNLKMHGKTVCPTSFARLNNISYPTLLKIANEQSSALIREVCRL